MRWGVGFPPEDRGVGVCFHTLCGGIGCDDGAHGELRGDDAALVVDAHEETHGGIEDDPCGEEDAGAVHADATEEEGYTGDQEAWFLVWEDGEEKGCGEGGDGTGVAEPGGY